MLKTLALCASVLAVASGLALAETALPNEPTNEQPVMTSSSSSLSRDHWLASDVYKAGVYDTSKHKVGNVTDLLIDSNGNVTAAIIGVGRFLDIGKKDVAIPFRDLKVSARDSRIWLVLNRTKDELQMAPAYDQKAETKDVRKKE
jgi:sporulation protein YlmC with PRC-barrel domain